MNQTAVEATLSERFAFLSVWTFACCCHVTVNFIHTYIPVQFVTHHVKPEFRSRCDSTVIGLQPGSGMEPGGSGSIEQST